VFYPNGNRVAFYDFCMVGCFFGQHCNKLLKRLLGVSEWDAHAVDDAMFDKTCNKHSALLATRGNAIKAFINQCHAMPQAKIHLGQMLASVTARLHDHQIALATNIVMFIKAFITLEGMGHNLNPVFHMTTEALPLPTACCESVTSCG
jgi:ubiquinone biosynthesis protein